MSDLDPTTFTEREKRIYREAFDGGYKSCEKFWLRKTAVIRRLAEEFADALENIR